VHAGDIVTVDATLFSGDSNENGEGEPLILLLPGGNFTVAVLFAAADLGERALLHHESLTVGQLAIV
jgi:hypothetical protein